RLHQRHRPAGPGRAQRRELLGASLLGVAGTLERQGPVAHLVAEKLYDYSGQLGRLQTTSRDFR
uniref:hypothetical protein n=1 Tax=Methylogaea oryzae TaxID=1295382 RepID=UPI00138F2A9B